MIWQSEHSTAEDRPTNWEINEAHDLLQDIMHSELLDDEMPEVRMMMGATRDVLCWILGHENDAFAQNLENWAAQWHRSGGETRRFDLN